MTDATVDRDQAGQEPRVARQLRAGLLVLAAAGVLGTAVELAILRHWDSFDQLIPWVVLVVASASIAVVAFGPTRRRVRGAQLLAAVTLLGGAYGVLEHISSNVSAGPLDATYGPKWATMSLVSRWWAAASGGVGPAPSLAPAVLVQISLCLLLATLAHPALRRADPVPS